VELLILFSLAFLAGLVDAVGGGGGLIQLPALLVCYPTAPLPLLFGTNKFASAQLFLSETARERFGALYALKASRSLSESVGLGTFAPATAELKA
jgi:uncharacterized membrane protein YfcA